MTRPWIFLSFIQLDWLGHTYTTMWKYIDFRNCVVIGSWVKSESYLDPYRYFYGRVSNIFRKHDHDTMVEMVDVEWKDGTPYGFIIKRYLKDVEVCQDR